VNPKRLIADSSSGGGGSGGGSDKGRRTVWVGNIPSTLADEDSLRKVFEDEQVVFEDGTSIGASDAFISSSAPADLPALPCLLYTNCMMMTQLRCGLGCWFTWTWGLCTVLYCTVLYSAGRVETVTVEKGHADPGATENAHLF
jgi:hypothetical protein